MDGSGTRTWEIHDALGSVRQTLAADGSVLPGGSYAYTPFGVVAGGNTPAPFGFTGELHSQGLVYLRARWYDPSSGAFTSRDPFAGFPTMPYSLHPYQYGYSNPLLYTDASGKYPDYGNSTNIWADNWALVAQNRDVIKEIAAFHAQGLSSFTTKAFAALMATHIARERRTSLAPWNLGGDIIKKVPGSTGIANMGARHLEAMQDAINNDSTVYNRWETGFDLASCDLETESDKIIMTDLLRGTRDGIVKPKRNHRFPLDALGVWIRQMIQSVESNKNGVPPTIFNVGQALFAEGYVEPVRHWESIFQGITWKDLNSTGPSGAMRYVHGLATLQAMDKAAKVLGYSGELTEADALPYFTSNDATTDESIFVECQIRPEFIDYGVVGWIQTPPLGRDCGPRHLRSEEALREIYGSRFNEARGIKQPEKGGAEQ